MLWEKILIATIGSKSNLNHIKQGGFMANYCTTAELYELFPEVKVLQFAGESAEASATVLLRVTTALTDASSKINLYLRSQYELPLESVDPVLKGLCADITIWILKKRRDILDKPTIARYDSALKELEKIAKGEIVLDLGVDAESGDYPSSVKIISDDPLGW